MSYSEFGKLESFGWADRETVDNYVAAFAKATDMAIGPVVKASGAGPGKRVLDLCCGHGAGTTALLAVGAEVTGLDFSPAMLRAARSRAGAAEFVEGDAQAMPFPDASFEAVVCSFGIMHIPDQPKALREVHRVLRPGGILVMTVWCGPELSDAFRIAFGSIRTYGDPGVALPSAPDFHGFADPPTARAMLLDAGFEDIGLNTIECAYKFARPDGLWEIFSTGTVRAKMLIDAQPQENREAIRQAMVAAVDEGFRDGPGYRVPALAALISASTPVDAMRR